MFLLFPPPLFTGEWICGAGTQAAGFRHMEINFRAENEIEFVCEYNYINFRFRSVIILEHECVCVCVCKCVLVLKSNYSVWFPAQAKTMRHMATEAGIRYPHHSFALWIFGWGIGFSGFGFCVHCRLLISCSRSKIKVLETVRHRGWFAYATRRNACAACLWVFGRFVAPDQVE